jgi:hypothetical protein
VWVLAAGSLVAVAFLLLRKPRFGAYVLAACDLAAFMMSIYAFYTYISAAFVGIDSTWETPFFVVMGLFLASTAVNAVAAFSSVPVRAPLAKIVCGVMAVLFAVSSVGGVIAGENAPQMGEDGTGSIVTPLPDPLIGSGEVRYEVYVDDADDSQYAGPTVSGDGSFAAPEHVHIPEKRHLFGFRRRNRDDDEISPQEWLGVADDFDARAVGKARGDWSSFRENDARSTVGNRNQSPDQTMGWRADRSNPDPVSDYDTGLDSAFKDDEEDFLDEDTGLNNGRWMGGAFSGRRSTGRDRYQVDDDEWAEFAEYADENYDENAFLDDGDYVDEPAPADGKGGRLRGITARFSRKGNNESSAREGRSSRGGESRRGRRSAYSPGEDDAWNVAAARAAERSAVVNVMNDPRVQEELGETYGFVDDPIANEVWFVALGAGFSDNAGMKAFLDEHADELRGAVVVSLEGIGDGELVGMASEGVLRKYKPTTRMKRFLRNAGQATGVRVGQAKMNWRDSAAAEAMRRGMPAITVAGVEGNVPKRYGSSDDVVENLDESTLKQRVNFILELLRTI